MSNSSVLQNAGIAQIGQITKSDRYLALSLTKEFDNVMDALNLKQNEQVDKSQLFDILRKLKLLKSVSQTDSEFISEENIKLFESVMTFLTQSSNEAALIDSETIRFFYLNLNYLWGNWLLRDSL